MRILLNSKDTNLAEQLSHDLQTQQLTELIDYQVINTADAVKGEPVTMTMVALAFVSAGGALTIAMGKDGALSRLAKVLEKYVASQQVDIVIEDNQGNRKTLSGSGKHIERILRNLQ